VRLYLINPSNPFVTLTHVKESRWNRYRVWKPLGLLAVAGLTPPEWEITLIDASLGLPDYAAMPRPDLVGITAFTAQVGRAYRVAAGLGCRPSTGGGLFSLPAAVRCGLCPGGDPAELGARRYQDDPGLHRGAGCWEAQAAGHLLVRPQEAERRPGAGAARVIPVDGTWHSLVWCILWEPQQQKRRR
jgi:hypothetical protein